MRVSAVPGSSGCAGPGTGDCVAGAKGCGTCFIRQGEADLARVGQGRRGVLDGLRAGCGVGASIRGTEIEA